VLIDCYQGVGVLGLDLARLGVDFAVGGMVKYLLGTSGLGFLYVRGELIRALLPTSSGWFAQEDIAAMDITANTPAASARRFEAGTPAVASCYAAEAGLKILEEVGLRQVEARVRALSLHCLERLQEIGWAASTPPEPQRHGPLVCVPARQVQRLVEELKGDGIVTSCRDGQLRASFHFYNNEEDVETLVQALARRRAQFR
jgi:selenocysteine lyase/cysteine desulfurase